MVAEVAETVLTTVFVLGLPLWLVVEELLHQINARATEPALERRRAGRAAVAADRAARAA